ncbi:MAG: hypothetical protein WCI43_03180 [Candidatus Firestonebacteria bacterium]
MKKLILIAVVCILSAFVSAQTTSKAPASKKPAPASLTNVNNSAAPIKTMPEVLLKKIDKDVVGFEVYVCEHHRIESQNPGKCAVCKMTLTKKMKSFTWKCQKCGMTSEKEGICSTDKVKFKKQEVLYRCVPDNVTQGEPGKCPKCGQLLKKNMIPIK